MNDFFSGIAIASTLIFVSNPLNAQTDENNFLVGASSNLTFISEDTGEDDNINNFLINIRGGYFVIDNLAAGLSVGVDNVTQGGEGLTTLNFGPFVRYYIAGKFFGGIGVDFVQSDPRIGESVNGGFISFEAGYPIFIGGEKVAIEPTLNYGVGVGELLEDYSKFGVQIGFFIYLQ
ncbi:MAG: hypothetical protein ABR574_02960 [Cryomorphaceae bacterium]|nr:hypothetical protein [Flavobacteriales bacterium]